jgi:pimeloyl-ACP methyl ester carboxylesterase
MVVKDDTVETKKSTEGRGNYGMQIGNILLSGIVMSVIAVIVWFLLLKSVKGVGAVILIVTIAMVALDTLIFWRLKNVRRIWRNSVAAVLALLNAVFFFSAVIYVLAPTQLFYPHFDDTSYAELKTRPGTEELNVPTENGNISGWMLHNEEASAPLVLYFCGNGENAATRMLRILNNGSIKTFKGCNLAILDYPGYGKTDGSPSEKSFKEFGLTAFDVLAQRKDVDPDRIIILGYSIGTGVADYVASKRDPAGLILMAPYSDGYDLYNGVVNIFHGPARILVAFRMESARFAKNVSISPLILASESDEMVKYSSSVRLSQAFPSGSTLKTLKNTGHNEFWNSETVLKYIEDYLAEVNAR